MHIHFADCTIDVDARTVWRGSRALHLSPKAFDLLAVLVQHPARVLTKRELFDRVWPDVFVSDASLAGVVKEVRHALGDSPRDARIVRTVYGHGYAFAAPVLADGGSRTVAGGGPATCWLTARTRSFGLELGEHVIGREPGVGIWLDSPKVSRHHARIVVSDSAVTIADLLSKNGTWVRSVRVMVPTVLHDGDVIRVGPYSLTFRTATTLAATETEARVRRERARP